MKVILCDDDAEYIASFRTLLENKLRSCYLDAEISEFHSGEQLLEAFRPFEYNIIFLDIEMDGRSGIDTANEIRKSDDKAIIVFLTHYPQYAPEGYKSRAFRYIRKNDPKDIINAYLDEIFSEYISMNKLITVIRKKKPVKVVIGDIKYAEISHRKITLYTPSEQIEYYGQMSDLCEKLEPYGFERIHKSMLVNMNYVEDIDKNYIVLKSGERFLISRNLKTHVKQRFMDAVLKRW